MTDDVARLSVIGQILRRKWRLLAVYAMVGALVGAGASLLVSPGYQTSAMVLVQGPRSLDELRTEAQIAVSSVVLDRVAAVTGMAASGADLRGSVNAKVTEGNLIEITGASDSPEQAQRLADQVAEHYVSYSAQLVSGPSASAEALRDRREALRLQVVETNRRITDLHAAAADGELTVEMVQARTQIERLRTGLAEALARLDEAERATGRANLIVVGPAPRPTTQAPPTVGHLVAAGAALFIVLGVLAQLVAVRADRRLRREDEIGSALGTSILGSLDVAVTTPDYDQISPASPARATLRRLLRATDVASPLDSPPRPVVGGELAVDVRYRRIITRLRAAPAKGLRVCVLVASDDHDAHRAAARFAVAAGLDGRPTSVVSDRVELTRMVQREVYRVGADKLRLTMLASIQPLPAKQRTVVRIVEVSPHRPSLPDRAGTSGVLIVVSPGTRTSDELSAMAEACLDAGHDVLGALLTHRTLPIQGSVGSAAADTAVLAGIARTSPNGSHGAGKEMAGSA